MRPKFHQRFIKQYRKLPKSKQDQSDERLRLFETHPFHSLLNNHPLKGKWLGYSSINITGDLRAVYRLTDQDTAYFVAIDTHHHLYSS